MTHPEILTFNLNWVSDPSPDKIMEVLVSVPMDFAISEITGNDSQPGLNPQQRYALKGMICYQFTGHYLAFFRRMLTKA